MQLERSHIETLQRLHLVSEFRDDETHEHTARVGTSARMLALATGEPAVRADLIEKAAPLHDLGKVGIPDSVLLKPGKLSEDEFDLIREHPTMGARIIGQTTSEVLLLARIIAETHHERWNGNGYPNGLRGAGIPVEGRIVAVCDVFDALTHERPYKSAWTLEQAIDELIKEKGQLFDPEIVDLFVDRIVPALPWVEDSVPRLAVVGESQRQHIGARPTLH